MSEDERTPQEFMEQMIQELRGSGTTAENLDQIERDMREIFAAEDADPQLKYDNWMAYCRRRSELKDVGASLATMTGAGMHAWEIAQRLGTTLQPLDPPEERYRYQ